MSENLKENAKKHAKTVATKGWLAILAIVLGLISYFGPKWLADDIKAAETVLHIPVVDFDESSEEAIKKKMKRKKPKLKLKDASPDYVLNRTNLDHYHLLV